MIEYDTVKRNHKMAEKYMVIANPVQDADEDFSDMWAEIYLRDYSSDKSLRNMAIR